MQKEKKVRAYTRKSKSGKTVQVKAHTQKYDAAEEARRAFASKKGAGEELSKVKKVKEVPADDTDLGFSEADFKAWYHWDMEDDPKNPQALKVKKALIAKMGRSAYSKYEDQMTDSYTARGHLKAFKGLGDIPSKEQVAKEKTRARRAKEAEVRQHQEDREKFGAGGSTLVAHVNGDYSNRYAVKRLSPMVKDEKFTKKVEGDAYSDFFPKGGSYEFFYGRRRDGRVGLYAKNGRSDIIELEEEEDIMPRGLKKALGEKPADTGRREHPKRPVGSDKNPKEPKPGLSAMSADEYKGYAKRAESRARKEASADSGKWYQKEYVAVRPFKSSYKPTGEDNIIKSVKVVAERGGYAPYGNGTGQIIIEGKAGSSKVFKTPEAAMRAVENLMISQWSPKTAAEQRGWSDARSADTMRMKHGMRANREREYIKSRLGVNKK